MSKSLKDVKWKSFEIGSLFTVSGVKGLPVENYKNGLIPYITTSMTTNGLACFVDTHEDIINKGYAISVDPIKGKSFFHKYDFIGRGYSGASINVLYGKRINKFIALFICTAIEKTASSKASYGYLFNGNRLKKGKILLPVTSKGEPDYKFMEEYIKEQESKIKRQYKDYIAERLSVIKNKIEEKKEWKEFFIFDIFSNIQRGKRLIKEKQIVGKTPYVSSTALNNGVDNFISNNKNVRVFENCLSLANSGSVGSCFYEPFRFIASDHVTHLKDNFSKYTYLFMATMLNRLTEKYNFNREINDLRIQREKIFLPITRSGKPDYDYMENYMKYQEQQKIFDYLSYLDS